MPVAADLFSVLHLGALSVFVGGTSVLMLVAVISRLRIRRPLLVWEKGPLTRIPIGPTLFLVGVTVVLASVERSGGTVPLSAVIGYPAGGVFWFVAAWLVRSVVVTEYGLVTDLPHLHNAVAWCQIVDYAYTTRDGQSHVVFLYRDRTEPHPCRLEFSVPDAHVDEFRQILQTKLDSRLSITPHPVSDEKTVGYGGDSGDPS